MPAFISKPLADLFGQPRQEAPRSDELLYGTPIRLLASMSGPWYKICTFYGYEGYVRQTSVTKAQRWDAALKRCLANSTLSRGETKMVIAPCCDVLSAPTVKASLLLTLFRGSYVYTAREEQSAKTSGYTPIVLYNGQTGYCTSSSLAECPPLCSSAPGDELFFRRQIVKTALSYLRTPYRWGGKSPLGIDCSGLSFMCYLLNGIVIYRDSDLRPGFPVRPIPADCAKPGDLLYFPGHIAIYLGSGEYVHATAHPGSDGVVINSLNPLSRHYRKDLHASLLQAGTIF